MKYISIPVVFLVIVYLTSCELDRREPLEEITIGPVELTGDSAMFFDNDPEYLHPDPDWTPSDEYPLQDVGNARILYYSRVVEWEADSRVENILLTLGTSEITFTSIKDDDEPVLGNFRNFLGRIDLNGNDEVESVQMLVDVNSLSSGVPGRDNRIINYLFRSMMPDLGTASLRFDTFEPNISRYHLARADEGYQMRAAGTFTLNNNTNEVVAGLSIRQEGNTIIVETVEPVIVLLTQFGLDENVYTMMKECNHRNVANAVRVNATLYFR